ncbi:MAG: pseudouridine-5'-phosphate glycosidase [Planctomycetota bacterium]|nr:pseudouridine-5'-phosphate glycosidase [Planctomycetota bacterium]
MQLLNRAGSGFVALETTLLVHGVPQPEAAPLAKRLADAVRAGGGEPALVGIVAGRPIVGLTDDELTTLLEAGGGGRVEKVNTANLGIILHRKQHGATTVSTTVELAARAGIRVMATGGIGGVHRGFASTLDISADLGTLARCPVAVVTSGVKSILDVAATRELLETLGVPVVGYRTDTFPAFYVRQTNIPLDARFDDAKDLATYVSAELARTGRGVVVANPCPEAEAMSSEAWEALLARATPTTTTGRNATPAMLAQIHTRSGGASLRANIALAEANARLAGALCSAMGSVR